MTWKQLTESGSSRLSTLMIDYTWRSGARSAMCAASQLPGRGPLMWMLPLYLHVNQSEKSDDDDDD